MPEDPFGADPSEDPDEEAPLPDEVGSGPWVKVLVAVTLVVLVGLGVAIVVALQNDDGGARRTVTVDRAVDTRVLLACRIPVPASAGLKMPENTVVLTGPHGDFEAGGVELGPGRLAVVVEGRLDVLPRGARLQNPCNTSGIG